MIVLLILLLMSLPLPIPADGALPADRGAPCRLCLPFPRRSRAPECACRPRTGPRSGEAHEAVGSQVNVMALGLRPSGMGSAHPYLHGR